MESSVSCTPQHPHLPPGEPLLGESKNLQHQWLKSPLTPVLSKPLFHFLLCSGHVGLFLESKKYLPFIFIYLFFSRCAGRDCSFRAGEGLRNWPENLQGSFHGPLKPFLLSPSSPEPMQTFNYDCSLSSEKHLCSKELRTLPTGCCHPGTSAWVFRALPFLSSWRWQSRYSNCGFHKHWILSWKSSELSAADTLLSSI